MDELRNGKWDVFLNFLLNTPGSVKRKSEAIPSQMKEDLLIAPVVNSQANEVLDAVMTKMELPDGLAFLKEMKFDASRCPLPTGMALSNLRQTGCITLLSSMGFNFNRIGKLGTPASFGLFSSAHPSCMLEALATGKVDVSLKSSFTGASLMETLITSILEKEKAGQAYALESDRATFIEVVGKMMEKGASIMTGKTGKTSLVSKVKKVGFVELSSMMEAEILKRKQGLSGKTVPSRRGL